MRKPSCILYGLSASSTGSYDLTLRFDADSNTFHIAPVGTYEDTGVRMTLEMAEILREIIDSGLSSLHPTPILVDMDKIPFDAEQVKPGELVVLSTQTHPDFIDDPELGYIIRHDFRDSYFGDRDEHERACTCSREDAIVFPTKFAALRMTQAMKHPIAVLPVTTKYVVAFRVTQSDSPRYYLEGDPRGVLQRRKAAKLTLKEAQTVLETFPPQLYTSLEKVLA